MIPLPSGIRVWLATGYTDKRKGFPCLALRVVQEVLRGDARDVAARAKLATRPHATGSMPISKMIGMDWRFSSQAPQRRPTGREYVDSTLDELSDQRRQHLEMAICPAVPDRHPQVRR